MSADVASGIERRLASTRNGVLAQLQACRDAGLHDELDGVLRDDIRIIESQVEELTLMADEEESEADRQRALGVAEKYGQQLIALRQAARQAILASKRQIDAQVANRQRNELLRPSNGAGLGLQRGAKTASSKDEELMEATANVTDGLRRTRQLMEQELDRSSLSMQMLERSTTTLNLTSTHYTSFSDLLTSSKKLITALEKADLLDRLLILAALALFGLVCLLVIKRRILDRGIRAASLVGKVGAGFGKVGRRGIQALAQDGLKETSQSVTASLTSLAAAATAAAASVSHDISERKVQVQSVLSAVLPTEIPLELSSPLSKTSQYSHTTSVTEILESTPMPTTIAASQFSESSSFRGSPESTLYAQAEADIPIEYVREGIARQADEDFAYNHRTATTKDELFDDQVVEVDQPSANQLKNEAPASFATPTQRPATEVYEQTIFKDTPVVEENDLGLEQVNVVINDGFEDASELPPFEELEADYPYEDMSYSVEDTSESDYDDARQESDALFTHASIDDTAEDVTARATATEAVFATVSPELEPTQDFDHDGERVSWPDVVETDNVTPDSLTDTHENTSEGTEPHVVLDELPIGNVAELDEPIELINPDDIHVTEPLLMEHTQHHLQEAADVLEELDGSVVLDERVSDGDALPSEEPDDEEDGREEVNDDSPDDNDHVRDEL